MKMDGTALRINDLEFYEYSALPICVRMSSLVLQRLLHVATDRSLPHAKKVFTVAENYEKTCGKKKKPAIVVPIIFYPGDVPTSVYDYVMRAPIAAGQYKTGYLFILHAVANQDAVYIRQPILAVDWGLPKKVAEVTTIDDILRAKDNLAGGQASVRSVTVPEGRISPWPNKIARLLRP